MLAFHFYATPDSEAQVMLFPDENSKPAIELVIVCDRFLESGNCWIACVEAGSDCKLFTSGQIYICNCGALQN